MPKIYFIMSSLWPNTSMTLKLNRNQITRDKEVWKEKGDTFGRNHLSEIRFQFAISAISSFLNVSYS